MINKEQVKALAKTMKFSLTEDEADIYSQKLSNIVSYLEMIQEIDTTHVVPTYHGTLNQMSPLREDQVVENNQVNRLLDNAGDTEETFIRVPAILNDGEGGA